MNRAAVGIAAVILSFWISIIAVAATHPMAQSDSQGSITDRTVTWPTAEQWRRVLLLEDYNTRVVILSTTLLGGAAGMVGSFTLLRKRALMGDALSHATLPGIGLAFIAATVMGGNGKSLPILLLGATLTGLLGMGAILLIRNLTRLKEDAALGAVLSVFFGAGVALLGVIQQMTAGHAAGLEAFIYGKTASMGAMDAKLIFGAAVVCITMCILLFKELKLLCFDEGFAGSHGLPVVSLDVGLMALVVVVTIVGLQAVGLILMVALLVIPASAARFWTEKMWRMAIISAVIGAVGGMVGAGISALFSKLPSGAMIVLVCASIFLLSLIFGTARGVPLRLIRRLRLNRSVDRQHLLRSIYEVLESSNSLPTKGLSEPRPIPIGELLTRRSWSRGRLMREIRRAQRNNRVEVVDEGVLFTPRGREEASRLTRQHRLWELYLITHADIAPGQVDRDADAIEHVLEPKIIAELEALLATSVTDVPASPHTLSAIPSKTAL